MLELVKTNLLNAFGHILQTFQKVFENVEFPIIFYEEVKAVDDLFSIDNTSKFIERFRSENLKDAVQDHLSAIFLISKHGSAKRREEAQCILDRYKGKNLSYHVGWDKNPSSPLTDWNRMGVYVMSSFVHVERSYAAARTNLCKAELSKQKTKKNNAAKVSTKPDECFAVKVKRNKSKNSIKQEAGKAKAANLKPWTNALKQARQNLGLDRHVTGKKGSELYKEAKKILRENI
mgnify:CR=1 FL=1